MDLTRVLASNLYIAHMMLAKKVPELQLTENEAMALGKASADVMEYYGLTVPLGPSLIGTLVMTIVAVHGPRVKAIAARNSAEQRGPGSVVQFPGGGSYVEPGAVAPGAPSAATMQAEAAQPTGLNLSGLA